MTGWTLTGAAALVLTACGGSSTPSAKTSDTTKASAAAMAPAGGRPAYCVPLDLAKELRPADGGAVTPASRAQFVKVAVKLRAAADLAPASVGPGLRVLASANDEGFGKEEAGTAAFGAMNAISPQVTTDCGPVLE